MNYKWEEYFSKPIWLKWVCSKWILPPIFNMIAFMSDRILLKSCMPTKYIYRLQGPINRLYVEIIFTANIMNLLEDLSDLISIIYDVVNQIVCIWKVILKAIISSNILKIVWEIWHFRIHFLLSGLFLLML